MSPQKWQLKILSIDLLMDLSLKQWGITGSQELIGRWTKMLSEATLKIICSGNQNGSTHILLITTSNYIFDHSTSILLEGI